MNYLGIKKEAEINGKGQYQTLRGNTQKQDIEVIVFYQIKQQAIVAERLAVAQGEEDGVKNYHTFETTFTAISPEVLRSGLINHCESTIIPRLQQLAESRQSVDSFDWSVM